MPEFGQNGPLAQQKRREGLHEERQRRLVAGAVIQLPGYGPVPMQARPEDMDVLNARYNIANELRARGDTTASIVFRDRDNGSHVFTPQQMIDLYLAANQWAQSIWQASWRLKEPEVPQDYADDRHW